MIEEHQWSCLRMFRRLSTILFLEYSMIVMLIYGLMCNLILMNWSLLLLPFLKFKFKKKLLGLFFFLNCGITILRFKHILQPISDVCITKEQQELVDFESFFTHTICHECCHGIGPHTITLPNGQESTVRLVRWILFFLFLSFVWFHLFYFGFAPSSFQSWNLFR